MPKMSRPEVERVCFEWGVLWRLAGLPKSGIEELIVQQLPHLVSKSKFAIDIDGAFAQFTHRHGARVRQPDEYWANILFELVVLFAPSLRERAESVRVQTLALHQPMAAQERLIYQFRFFNNNPWFVNGFSTAALGDVYDFGEIRFGLYARQQLADLLGVPYKKILNFDNITLPLTTSQEGPAYYEFEDEESWADRDWSKETHLRGWGWKIQHLDQEMVIADHRIVELPHTPRGHRIIHGAVLTEPDTYYFCPLRDEIPVILVDKEFSQIAIVTVGLTTANPRVFSFLINHMQTNTVFGTSLEAYVGPGIYKESLTLRESDLNTMIYNGSIRWDVDAFSYAFESEPFVQHIDLIGFVKAQLSAGGISRDVIFCGIDTYSSDEFFSETRQLEERGDSMGFGCIIGLGSGISGQSSICDHQSGQDESE